MTDVQAAIGLGQMRHLSEWQDRRVEVARAYDRQLSRIPGLTTPAWPDHGQHAWHLYVVQLDLDAAVDRDTFIRVLAERGVDCSVHFIPLHHQPYFQRLLADQISQSFPVADAIFPTIVSLPFYPALTDDMIERVCEEIDGIMRPANTDRQRWPVAAG
jgi:perosamine synthetase